VGQAPTGLAQVEVRGKGHVHVQLRASPFLIEAIPQLQAKAME